MTLWRFPSDRFWTDSSEEDRKILNVIHTNYQRDITLHQAFWSEADLDSRFSAADQELWDSHYGTLPIYRRRMFNFNRIKRIVNMVSGFQRKNRKSIEVTPIELADDAAADDFSEIMAWLVRKGDFLRTISDAFESAITTGLSFLHVWMDYRNDPINGDINLDYLAYNSFIMDSFWRKQDLSDCHYIWGRRYLSKNQIKTLLPEREKDIDAISRRGNKDGLFPLIPENFDFDPQFNSLLAYDEYYYADYRDQSLVVNLQTGETMDWTSTEDDLQEFKKEHPQVAITKTRVRTIRLAILVQGKVFYHGPSPDGCDTYPFVPVVCYYDPQIAYYGLRIRGLVRDLRDSQYLYNHRKRIELRMLESQITSGWKFKEDALVNPEHIFMEGEGRGLALKDSAQMSDVEKIQPPELPSGLLELVEDVSGRDARNFRSQRRIIRFSRRHAARNHLTTTPGSGTYNLAANF